jgi:hypothetical protein
MKSHNLSRTCHEPRPIAVGKTIFCCNECLICTHITNGCWQMTKASLVRVKRHSVSHCGGTLFGWEKMAAFDWHMLHIVWYLHMIVKRCWHMAKYPDRSEEVIHTNCWEFGTLLLVGRKWHSSFGTWWYNVSICVYRRCFGIKEVSHGTPISKFLLTFFT